MKLLPIQVPASALERELVIDLANAVRAGAIDDAANTLAGRIQRAYDIGFADGLNAAEDRAPAPLPSPPEQREIERFGIWDEEEGR